MLQRRAGAGDARACANDGWTDRVNEEIVRHDFELEGNERLVNE